MKKSFTNQVTIAGILYQHNLEEKETGPNSKNPGTKYITGTIDIATDDAMQNVVSIHYTYITATTSKGNANRTYGVLASIMDGTYHNFMEHGDGVKIQAFPSVDLNEFYVDPSAGETEERLVSNKRNEGGYLSIVRTLLEEDKRNQFKCDMIVTKVTEIEANEEQGLAARATVGGCVFNFRNELLPVEFVVTNPAAINYFLSQDASSSNPFPTQVWGPEVSTTIKRKKITENAFGEADVQETVYTRKEFIITGALAEPYEWDDPAFITAEELKELISKRELHLATLKKNRAEYKANKAVSNKAAVTSSAINSTPDDGFKF